MALPINFYQQLGPYNVQVIGCALTVHSVSLPSYGPRVGPQLSAHGKHTAAHGEGLVCMATDAWLLAHRNMPGASEAGGLGLPPLACNVCRHGVRALV